MRVERATVVFGGSELVSEVKWSVLRILTRNSASHKIRERPSARITYRLRGSLVLRDLACATGSKDFAASSDTGVVKEDAVSSSSERRLAGASSEALRRPRKAWGRAEGMNARGNARARYLDCSLAAIMCIEW